MNRAESLIVLGNGPSLKGFDFARFRRFDVIGMNAAYRFWDRIGWYPKYYICLDTVVGVSHATEIARLIREREKNGIRFFILRRVLIERLPEDIRGLAPILDFDAVRKTLPWFRKVQPITTGSHSTLVGAMLGYRHIMLMGIDCQYVERIEGSIPREGTILQMEKTPDTNPNYFFDDYQQAGDKYHVPNPSPDLHLDSWRAASEVLTRHNVEVWNGNPQSQVDIFPFMEFSEFERRNSRVRKWLRSMMPSEDRAA